MTSTKGKIDVFLERRPEHFDCFRLSPVAPFTLTPYANWNTILVSQMRRIKS